MSFHENKTQKIQDDKLPLKLRPKSKFDPTIQNSMLDAFQQVVSKEVNDQWEIYSNKNIKSNLTKKEKLALAELKKDSTITAKKADKGGATIIMDTALYLQEAESQLRDTTVYQLLHHDPTSEYKKEIDSTIEEACELGIISLGTKNALINEHPRTPILYLVPKIHKDSKRPPG